MHSTHEVISAFVDDEPFDANELAASLSDPEGRSLLIDLIALRHVVQSADRATVISAAEPRTNRRTWFAGIAAGLVLVASAGYLTGRSVANAVASRNAAIARPSDAPPPATRVIELKPGVNWQDSNGGY